MTEYELIPLNCPKCGASINCYQFEKIIRCNYCESRIVLSIDTQKKMYLRLIENGVNIATEEAITRNLLNGVGEFQILIMRKIYNFYLEKQRKLKIEQNELIYNQIEIDLKRICEKLRDIEDQIFISKKNAYYLIGSAHVLDNHQNSIPTDKLIRREVLFMLAEYKKNNGRCILEFDKLKKDGVNPDLVSDLFVLSMVLDYRNFDSWMEHDLFK